MGQVAGDGEAEAGAAVFAGAGVVEADGVVEEVAQEAFVFVGRRPCSR
ncbi:hypothetical protein IAG44_38785 [Streptomyces roseirectus]|uniref:Uncharacterized protein n=1 Tax=Streptomyces roseirectus TaxID=2768066 RepID=A0A7H0IPV1_9ACTN|nr:hypothetical protein IAG44_38785 [Streptomyces roseirectus]